MRERHHRMMEWVGVEKRERDRERDTEREREREREITDNEKTWG